MKNILIYLLALFMLTGCAEEKEQPECELPDFTWSGCISKSNHVRDNGLTYERWCGPRYIRDIDPTEEAMKEEGCTIGMDVEGRWECQAGFSTDYNETLVVCDCRPTVEGPSTPEQQAP